jgi:hypothetical protein
MEYDDREERFIDLYAHLEVLIALYPETVAKAHEEDFARRKRERTKVLSPWSREEHRQFVEGLATGLDLTEDEIISLYASGPVDCICGFCRTIPGWRDYYDFESP